MIAAGLHAFFEAYLAETERLLANNDQKGFYKHLTSTVGLEGTKARSEQFNRDEDGTLLRDKVRIRERRRGFYHKLSNTKSLKLDRTIIDLMPPRPLKLSLGNEPSMDEMTEDVKLESIRARWSPGRTPESRPPCIRPVLSQHPCQCLGNRRSPPPMEKYAIIKVLHKKIPELTATTTEGLRLLPTQAKFC